MSAPRILVVDDNPINLKLVSDLLVWEGYDVARAVDAVTAIAAIGQAAPDLVLMDIALPGMDGLALTRQLKADPQTCGIRVIAVTAFAMKGDAQKAFEAGCDGYLPKPLDTRALPGIIAQFLSSAPRDPG